MKQTHQTPDHNPTGDEHSLLLPLIAGNKEAFESYNKFYCNTYCEVYERCLEKTGSAPVAEELTTEIFSKFWREKTQLNKDSFHPHHYLLQLAAYYANKQFINGLTQEGLQLIQRIGSAALQLSQQQQAILKLAHYNGCSPAQIAEQLTIPEAVVSHALQEAMQQLENAVRQHTSTPVARIFTHVNTLAL